MCKRQFIEGSLCACSTYIIIIIHDDDIDSTDPHVPLRCSMCIVVTNKAGTSHMYAYMHMHIQTAELALPCRSPYFTLNNGHA